MSQSTRSRIRRFVEAHPGQHFSGIGRELDLAPGQVQYHLRRLRKTEAIVRASFYGQTHYYPAETSPWERGALAVARRETSRDVLVDLVRYGNSRPGDVADRVGIARSTLEYHLDRLIERDLVRKERGSIDDSNGSVVLVLERPERTVEILQTVDPSLPERLVDRFERLVDHLLESP
jgi:predicted transcriptional regulator